MASGEARPDDTWNRTTKQNPLGQISFTRDSRPTTDGYELHTHPRLDPFAIGYADFDEGESSAIPEVGSDGKKHGTASHDV